jgi:hypothetical protein
MERPPAASSVKQSKINIMKIRFFTVLSLLFSFACSNISPEEASAEKTIFSTNAPSHLFFKNMRSSYYQATQQAGTKVDLYQLRKIKTDASVPLIYPVIADNWMKDEAYLLIQTNEYEKGFQSPLSVYWSDEAAEGVIEMKSPPNFEHQYAFALELEEVLKKNYSLFVLDGNEEQVPVFESYDQKSWFLTALRDYKKLIE